MLSVQNKVLLSSQIKNLKDQSKSTPVLDMKIVILDQFILSVVTYNSQKFLWLLVIGAPSYGWMIWKHLWLKLVITVVIWVMVVSHRPDPAHFSSQEKMVGLMSGIIIIVKIKSLFHTKYLMLHWHQSKSVTLVVATKLLVENIQLSAIKMVLLLFCNFASHYILYKRMKKKSWLIFSQDKWPKKKILRH